MGLAINSQNWDQQFVTHKLVCVKSMKHSAKEEKNGVVRALGSNAPQFSSLLLNVSWISHFRSQFCELIANPICADPVSWFPTFEAEMEVGLSGYTSGRLPLKPLGLNSQLGSTTSPMTSVIPLDWSSMLTVPFGLLPFHTFHTKITRNTRKSDKMHQNHTKSRKIRKSQNRTNRSQISSKSGIKPGFGISTSKCVFLSYFQN